MLDAYIIERIRRERESREQTQRVPLRIETPPAFPYSSNDPDRSEQDRSEHEQDRSDRGVAIIDFTI